jgi:hypothetical protein
VSSKEGTYQYRGSFSILFHLTKYDTLLGERDNRVAGWADLYSDFYIEWGWC